MIDFTCSACSKKLKVKDEHAGKKVKCPCGAVNAVPAASAKKLGAAAEKAEAGGSAAAPADPDADFDFYGADDEPKGAKTSADEPQGAKTTGDGPQGAKAVSAPESIRLTCPACGKKLKVKAESAGKKAKCPCGAQIPVPAPTRDDEQEEDEEDAPKGPSRQEKDNKRIFALTGVIGVAVLVFFLVALGAFLMKNSDKDKGVVAQTTESEEESAPGKKYAPLPGKMKSAPAAEPVSVEKPRFDGLYYFDDKENFKGQQFFTYLRFYPDGHYVCWSANGEPNVEEVAKIISINDAKDGKGLFGKYSTDSDRIVARHQTKTGPGRRHTVRIKDGVMNWDGKPCTFKEVKFTLP